MREQDVIIGKKFYGWTHNWTPKNNWFSSFFECYMPQPTSAKTMYPSWSESNEWALKLIEDIVRRGIILSIIPSDVGYEVSIGYGEQKTGHGDSIPHAIADMFSRIPLGFFTQEFQFIFPIGKEFPCFPLSTTVE